jgi:hypothetical protein
LRRFHGATAGLLIATNLLFLALFAGVPAILFTRLGGHWQWIIGPGALAWLASAVLYLRAVSVCLVPAERPPSGKRAGTVLSPVAAIRGGDGVSRDLLAPFDPLVVAALTLSRRRFADVARETLAELIHVEDTAPEGERAEWRARLARRSLGFLSKSGIDAALLFRPAPRHDPSCATFCPRCLAQYHLDGGCCATCPGPIRLLSLDAPPELPAAAAPAGDDHARPAPAAAPSAAGVKPSGTPRRRGRRGRGGASRR